MDKSFYLSIATILEKKKTIDRVWLLLYWIFKNMCYVMSKKQYIGIILLHMFIVATFLTFYPLKITGLDS